MLLLPKPRSIGAHVGAHAQTRSRIPEARRGTLSRFAFWRSDSSCLKHKTAVLYSTRSWAARRRNKVDGKKREKWEKWRQRWGTQLELHIPDVYVCECALQCSEREKVGAPSVCYRHNSEFFIIHHCSTAPSPPLSWQILKLHAWPRDLKEVMTRGRNPWQKR